MILVESLLQRENNKTSWTRAESTRTRKARADKTRAGKTWTGKTRAGKTRFFKVTACFLFVFLLLVRQVVKLSYYVYDCKNTETYMDIMSKNKSKYRY